MIIFQQIGKNIERGKDFKDAIASCCKADKELEYLLTTVNESMSINDVEFSDDEFVSRVNPFIFFSTKINSSHINYS